MAGHRCNPLLILVQRDSIAKKTCTAEAHPINMSNMMHKICLNGANFWNTHSTFLCKVTQLVQTGKRIMSSIVARSLTRSWPLYFIDIDYTKYVCHFLKMFLVIKSFAMLFWDLLNSPLPKREITSKTEVLQMPSATDVNLGY